MQHFIYNTLLRAATPLAHVYLRSSGKGELLQRFHVPLPEGLDRPIWIHGCSVGETALSRALAKEIRATQPEAHLLLTASTATGLAALRNPAAPAASTYLPFDTPRAVQRFLDALQPAILVLIETELWPNLLRSCTERQIPVVVVNGRLSEKHYLKYQRWSGFFRPVFASLTAVAAQNELYADRFAALGVPKDHIEVYGNMKFDGVSTEMTAQDKLRLRQACGLSKRPVIVFGSTRPGDEALAAEVIAALRPKYADAVWVVAPRHIDRAAEVEAILGPGVTRRTSQTQKGYKGIGPGGVLLLDTLGELQAFYGVAQAAVVGGSFYPGVEGHNPLEAAALGTPTLFGPHMKNFQQPADVLIQARGALQLPGPDALAEALDTLLQDPAEQRQLGTRGRKAVLANQGAIGRSIEMLRLYW